MYLVLPNICKNKIKFSFIYSESNRNIWLLKYKEASFIAASEEIWLCKLWNISKVFAWNLQNHILCILWITKDINLIHVDRFLKFRWNLDFGRGFFSCIIITRSWQKHSKKKKNTMKLGSFMIPTFLNVLDMLPDAFHPTHWSTY